MLAGSHAVTISVLIPLTIHIDEQGPVVAIGEDSVGISNDLTERVVALERLKALHKRTSRPVSSFHLGSLEVTLTVL